MPTSNWFQSTPRFVGEGNQARFGSGTAASGFNPPPALSARGTGVQRLSLLGIKGFNPPPALSARGTRGRIEDLEDKKFQSTPRFVGEGNPVP